jgi:hypothetical protein
MKIIKANPVQAPAVNQQQPAAQPQANELTPQIREFLKRFNPEMRVLFANPKSMESVIQSMQTFNAMQPAERKRVLQLFEMENNMQNPMATS